MLERHEALAGLGGLAYCQGNVLHPPALRSNTLRIPWCRSTCSLELPLHAALDTSEGAMQQADDCVWQVDDLQLSTAPPRSLSYNLDTVLY